MSTINKVLIGFASVACTAVAFSAAVSPAIGIAQQETARVMPAGAKHDTKVQVMAGLWKRPAPAGKDTCASQIRQRTAQCGRTDAAAGQGRVFSLLD